MKTLALIVLGHTVTGQGPLRGAVDFGAHPQPSTRLTIEATPLGLIAQGERFHGSLESPSITVTGLPVLAASGVDVWRGEWFVVAGVQ